MVPWGDAGEAKQLCCRVRGAGDQTWFGTLAVLCCSVEQRGKGLAAVHNTPGLAGLRQAFESHLFFIFILTHTTL